MRIVDLDLELSLNQPIIWLTDSIFVFTSSEVDFTKAFDFLFYPAGKLFKDYLDQIKLSNSDIIFKFQDLLYTLNFIENKTLLPQGILEPL
jgi:hypothetical protein